MLPHIFWSGFTSKERAAAILELERIINQFGFIIDFQPFSDISLSIVIEVEESHIDQLHDALAKYLHMNTFDKMPTVSTKERTIYLNVTFSNAKGNLRNEIPAVPG